ncbi:MAG: DegV family protein [Clostridium sp.]|nr:DegV family protein [Clostridium sp.]
MKWNIITDSSCDLLDLESQNGDISFSSIPFVISIGTEDYVDNEELDVPEMVTAMEKCGSASHTSCPPPYAWYEQFEKPGYAIAVTISSKLSGSYNSAHTARDMILERDPEKRVALIDSRSAGSEIVLVIKRLYELIEAGNDFDDVIRKTEEFIRHTHVIFALSSFDNLVKNGRMNKIVGFIAGKLGFWGIGIGSEEGTIKIKQKVRGNGKALEAIIEDMKERCVEQGTVIISHCQNAELAEKLKTAIRNLWPDVKVGILPARGLCSYYAERGGLIVGY